MAAFAFFNLPANNISSYNLVILFRIGPERNTAGLLYHKTTTQPLVQLNLYE